MREFIRRDVDPVASEYDNRDVYPTELVEKMAAMGLFGITVSEEYARIYVYTR